MSELLRQRQVRPHLTAGRLDLCLVGADRDESIRGIPRQEPQKDEKDDARHKEREDENGEPADYISEDWPLLPRLASNDYSARLVMPYAKNCEFSPFTG